MSLAVPTSHSFLTLSGPDIVLSSTTTELTISQAAQLLDAPEGVISELVALGVLEYREQGTQRCVDREQVLRYKQHLDDGEEFFRKMMLLDQEMGLYDE